MGVGPRLDQYAASDVSLAWSVQSLSTRPDSCLALDDRVPALAACLWCTLSGTLSPVDVDMLPRQRVLHSMQTAIPSLELDLLYNCL